MCSNNPATIYLPNLLNNNQTFSPSNLHKICSHKQTYLVNNHPLKICLGNSQLEEWIYLTSLLYSKICNSQCLIVTHTNNIHHIPNIRNIHHINRCQWCRICYKLECILQLPSRFKNKLYNFKIVQKSWAINSKSTCRIRKRNKNA